MDPRPFCAYWERDYTRSTPFPLPIDKQMKLSKLAMRCHESIPGMWVSDRAHAGVTGRMHGMSGWRVCRGVLLSAMHMHAK